MSEIGFHGGEIAGVRRREQAGHHLRRRLLLLSAVTLLCGAAYLAGLWSGTQTDMTCSVTRPGVIECSSGGGAPWPTQPTTPLQPTASA